jgi:ribosomal protein S18 acetylase RimI-like enzyme
MNQVFVPKQKINQYYLEHLFEKEIFFAYYILEECDSHTGTNKIIGGAGIQDCPEIEGQPKTCELCRFYIDSNYRGASYGKFFLMCLINFVKKQGYERIFLETVPEKMQPAIKMYRGAGFFDTKNRPPHCWDITGEKGHLFMELTLNQPNGTNTLLRSKL